MGLEWGWQVISIDSNLALRTLVRPSALRMLDAIRSGANTVEAVMAATGDGVTATYSAFKALVASGLIVATGTSVGDRFATARVTVAERLRAIAEEVDHGTAP